MEEISRLKKKLGLPDGAAIPDGKIPRPPGAVGNWKIQDEMQLGDTEAQSLMYAAIQRTVKDAVNHSPIDWKLPWAEIPPKHKADLFATGMDRYVQDWATEGLARQLMKNKRAHSYRKGYITVPPQFGYLKVNAQKRSDAPRGSELKRKAAAMKRKERAAKKTKTTKGKGKAKAMESSDDDDDEQEEDEVEDGGKKASGSGHRSGGSEEEVDDGDD
ncbi:hypothetical protein NLJ89_g9766 [Agrocybe chaxingu]|uniref:Uncharacterized protein n=1 Tax=Agrocybe chaxingu TaxID=84603 RepID=A0A9W8JVA4_9AGAR|nr:hypothetical protein NLJ89_g9766 [Agrocybe chaxingu]